MSIRGQANLNIGTQNQQAGSDSLYVAFNKIQNNFTTIFSQASTYTTFVGGAGIGATSNATSGTVNIVNTGVLNLNPGTGITLSGSNGNVTVSVSGNVTGELVAGVTNVGITSNSLTITNSPIVGAGQIGVELPTQVGFAAGTYIAATVTVDQYGRITDIEPTLSSGTVTSIGITGVDGIAVNGGPITSNGTIEITNTGVVSLTAGTGITLSGQTGNITISAGLDRDVGTVTRIGVESNTLSILSGSITTNGNLIVELPFDATFDGNIGIGGNLLVSNRANFEGVTNLGDIGNVVILGGSSGQVLATDGTGNLNWTAPGAGGGGAASIGGTTTQIQFNDAGSFAGNTALTFTKASGRLNATLFAGSGANLTNIPGANITGNIPNANITSSLQVGASANFTGSANVFGFLAVYGPAFATTATAGTSNTVLATTAFVSGAISTATSVLATGKANIASPALTGTPTAPTASISVTPSTQIATTAYVNNFVTTAVAASFTEDTSKAPIASPNFTGIPVANTAAYATNTRQIATTAFVQNALSPYALKDSPTLTGTPLAPTPSSGDNSTKIATTAFVQSSFPSLATYAPVLNPTFTGNPSAPTPTTGDNSTKLATTAFVKTAVDTANSDLKITYGQTDSSNFDVFPPTGYTMTNLKGFIPSINAIYYAGGVDGNDTMRCYYTVGSDRINVICNNSEQRRHATTNWLAIWSKN